MKVTASIPVLVIALANYFCTVRKARKNQRNHFAPNKD